MKLAVILFNLGGPDSPEAIEPFLRNLFSDPAILSVPGFVRAPLARFIARRRAPVAKEIYAKIGGRSPILEETEAQARAIENVLAARGHEVVPLLDGMQRARPRLLPPTLVIDPDRDSAVMGEEIFGPILPVISYASIEDAIGCVLGHDRPLALYCFSGSEAEIEVILSRVVAGGVCVNDTLYQFGCNDLPFGGVGASGMGHYHAREGFITFSKLRPVFRQGPFSAVQMLFQPPYAGRPMKLMDLLMRLKIGKR